LNTQNQLHVISKSSLSSGGEAVAAVGYIESLANEKFSIQLVSNDTPPNLNTNNILLTQGPSSSNLILNFISYYLFFKNLFKKEKFNAVHIHGMWTGILFAAAIHAKKNGVPIIISPHGCLQSLALGRKPIRKFFALSTYQGWILNSAKLFVATSDLEYQAIKLRGLPHPIAIIPIGISPYVPLYPPTPREKVILFLSRLDPGKGLADLIDAWKLVRDPNWKIVIAGSGNDQFSEFIRDRIVLEGLESEIKLIGHVEDAEKKRAFDQSSLFILPTYSENFGIAIAEALNAGLPVITTTGSPWKDILTYGCGWWINPGVDNIAIALKEAISCHPSLLKAMGFRGQKLISDKYSPELVKLRAETISKWVVNPSTKKPDFFMDS